MTDGLATLMALSLGAVGLALMAANGPPPPSAIRWNPVTTLADGRPLPKPVAWYELEQSRDGVTWTTIAKTRVTSRSIAPPYGTCYRVRTVIGGPRVSEPSKALCYGLLPPRNLTFTVGKP